MEITEEFLQKIRYLMFAEYHIDQKKDTLLTSYFKGYVYSDEELRNYISQYLWERHKIDSLKNTWEQQVDHYAFEQNLDWDRGFFHLREAILEEPYELKNTPVYVYNDIEKPVIENISNTQESVQLKNGTTIRLGDIIQLSDKIGEDYKKTKFYDMSLRNPSWELFYPSEQDFQYVSFYYKGDENVKPFNFGRVRRLFSDSTEVIESICIQDEVVFLYTSLFKIDIEKALEAKEVKLLQQTVDSPTLSDFSNLLFEMQSSAEYGRISTMSGIMEILNYWCFHQLSFLKKEWHKFSRTRTGAWIQA